MQYYISKKNWEIDPFEYQTKHGDYPAEFKIYAFEKLILKGTAYSRFNSQAMLQGKWTRTKHYR